MAQEAFDLAERLQTPVFVLSDLDLGMNNWMADPFPYPEKPFDRGKVLDAEGVERLKETWGRYRDLDGDGIPWRTLPGTAHPKAAYFTRGSGHNEMARLLREAARLRRRTSTASRGSSRPRAALRPEAGDRGPRRARRRGSSPSAPRTTATTEARDRLEREHGLPLDYLRLRALPLAPEAREWIERHDVVYVVEQNRDAQLATLLRDEMPELRRALRLRPPVRRPPARRDDRRRRRPFPPRTQRRRCPMSAATPTPAAPKTNRIGLAEGRLRGGEVDPLPRLRPRRHHEADRHRLLRDGRRAAPGREVLGHRLLLEDARLLPEPRVGLQRRPRPDAVRRDGRAPRESRARRHRRLGRRRHRLDRHRAVRPPRAAEHAARLRRREQRRLRPHEGAVLRDGRRRLHAEGGRRERPRPDRPLRPRHRARLRLRRPLLLGRHEAAPGDPPGRDRAPGDRGHRRHLPLRHVQRPRGLDEELQVRRRTTRSRSTRSASSRTSTTRSPRSRRAR